MDSELKSFNKPMNLLGIRWAPLNVPLNRRLQTLAISVWVFLLMFSEPVAVYVYIKLVYSRFWWLAMMYAVWLLSDVEIGNRGGRMSTWVQSWRFWDYYCDYFPAKLIKTADLDPTRNYLFAVFPHGILPMGAMGAFGTRSLNFHKLFPGMTTAWISFNGHFVVPLIRDFALAMGMCSSTPESLMYLLDKKRYKGKCVILTVGGSAEAMLSKPKEYKIILRQRKGFVRIAMKSGAPIVPVISFGEVDLYRNSASQGTGLGHRIQEKIRQVTGIMPVFPIGRGFFQYSFGFLPRRKPITTVVGAPIEIERNMDPTEEEVDAIHAEFQQRLIDLFESEKKCLSYHEEAKLVIT